MTQLRSLLKKLEKYHFLAKCSYDRAKYYASVHLHPQLPPLVHLDWQVEQVLNYFEDFDRHCILKDRVEFRQQQVQKRWEVCRNLLEDNRLRVIVDSISSIFFAHARLVPYLVKRILCEACVCAHTIMEKRYQAHIRASNNFHSQCVTIMGSLEDKWTHRYHVMCLVNMNSKLKEAVINFWDARKINRKRRLNKIKRLIRTVKYTMWKERQNI